MPQMSPIYWLILLAYFIFILLLMTMLIFFFFFPLQSNKFLLIKGSNSLNWTW
uniref:ATP synthase F0 subunit 8 n=1 Tax=Karenia caelatata TaxID=1195089 RepID=UPI001EE12ADE|nr:ATP synthase F0 subunit 8 [Karenia caelatata]UJX87004.1 ATP synthase F0 subunit 8 [Karenia caelatata]